MLPPAKIRTMNGSGDPTHISAIFMDLLKRQYLRRTRLELRPYFLRKVFNSADGRSVFYYPLLRMFFPGITCCATITFGCSEPNHEGAARSFSEQSARQSFVGTTDVCLCARRRLRSRGIYFGWRRDR